MAANPSASPVSGIDRVVRGACPHDCPDTCALNVTVRDGVAIRVAGDPAHPPTNGVLCTKVSRYLERTYSTDRLSRPLRRVGPKGAARFEPASWDEALDDIAARLRAVAARDPQRILPYSYAGTMGLVQGDGMGQRVFHALGASLLDRTICSSPGMHGLAYTLGGAVGMDVERFADAGLILIWGSNPITSSVHFWALAQQAKRRGAKLVAIDPYRSATAERCDVHLALRPGTDGALALGLVQQLVEQDLVDRDWVDAHTLGYDGLVARAAAWTPRRVAATCGIDADAVVALARDYGTIAPAAIRLNYGMQRVRGGANAVRLVAGLPALIGAWKHPAGGMLLSASGHYNLDVA
ncbi:MAG TPA: molybdopterin-dependent oxidoreductase, partial [Burkholderiaceae bacterium]|nr:molybdopterin-dependent oxidoreductase [Burkholderiaceae bacterium]